MKKILNFSALFALCLSSFSFTGCNSEELDTDQYAGTIALAAIAPNPVMRGGQLRIIGSNLEKVSEVRFAGDVTVTSIETVAKGSRSEIRVTVPVDGPAVGPVTIVTPDGTSASTRFNLEFTEPIVISSVSPAEALSGDVITIQGEYLNNVREVIFGGEVIVTEFLSQSRREMKVAVPSAAVTGYVIAGDVNEIEDENTIPNRIYSPEELTIGKPSVVVAEKATYKSGDVIKVSGSHLDMIKTVNLNGASGVEFSVSGDGSSISFNLPSSATDGGIELVSYGGDSFNGGEIETVTVADLGIASLEEDGRFKAGGGVEITGSDLDLVNKVEFNGAEASWYYSDGSIFASVPDAAKDGSVTVTLASGKQAYTEAIEVVKPVATAISGTEAVAGKQKLAITGEDLDLVTGAKIGDKIQGFINCGFDVRSADSVIVVIPSDAYTGVITLTAASGYETMTETVNVSYDEAI